MKTAAAFAALALSALAQSFNIGPGGPSVSDDGLRVDIPEPVRVGRELVMNELPLRQTPAQFYLNVGTSGRLGPFDLADGAAVGSKQHPYTLRMADHGSRFTLEPTSGTNAALGPFTATNGAPVLLGGAPMKVVRFPPRLVVSLSHPTRIAQMPAIGVAPLSQPVMQALYDLRGKYVNLANRVDADTASAEMANVPRVRNNITGNTFSPVVKTSQRDRQNAYKGAELSAMTFLDKVFAQAFTIRSQAITDGLTFHFQLPQAGDYVLCATQRVKDPNAASLAGSVTAVWWTTFHFDGEHPLSLALTGDNAVTWRQVFSFDKP
jgi:hypothetical protein